MPNAALLVSLAIAICVFSFGLRAQQLHERCNPASSTYDRPTCEEEPAYKREMADCLTGGGQAIMKQDGLESQNQIPQATQDWIEAMCRERLVPEMLRGR